MDMPNKYNYSCIYKIYKDDTIYIGSTINFRKRMIQHKSACNNEKSKSHNLKIYKTIRLNGGWSAFQKEVIENICCKNKKELEKIERKYIESIGNLNNNIPGRTIKERMKEYYEQNKERIKEYQKEYNKEYQKEYYEQNKERIKEYQKEYNKEYKKEYYEQNKDKIKQKNKKYREQNKEKISQKEKEYYKQNKEKISQREKVYYKQNKEKINQRRKIKIVCEYCNSLIRKDCLRRHQKSKKCLSIQKSLSKID